MELPITIITAEEQEVILSRKLQERIDIQALIADNNQRCQQNRAVVYDLCKNDFVYFCDNFLWIPDPEAENPDDKDIPFLLYQYQEDSAKHIINAIVTGYDIPIEKSRKMGLSLLVLAVAVWGWHFHKWDVLVGSEKASKADTRGDLGSMVEKARYMIRNCPEWIIPRLDQKKFDKAMLLVHPAHGAKLKADSNSTEFGRGDRAKVTVLDEFTAWSQTDKQAWAACSATSKCRIPLSTPNHRGKNCYYYQVVNNAKKKELPYLRLHWSLNPIFAKEMTLDEYGKPTSPWYENEKKRSTSPQEVAAELDIDYDAFSTGNVFPDFDYEQNIVEGLEYDPNLPLYCSWDFGLDQTAILWIQPDFKNQTINIVDEYVNDGTTSAGSDIYHYIDVVDMKPYKQAIHFGDPHSGNNRNLAARGASNASILRRRGVRFKRFAKVPKIAERISAGRNIIKQVRVSDKCILTIDMFSEWKMKRQLTGNQSGSVPEHSVHSHIGDAYSYFCWGHKERRQEIRGGGKRNYTRTLGGVSL